MRRAVLIVVGLAALGGCRMEAPERGEARERAEETGFRGRVIEDPAPRPDFELADVRGGTFDFREETEGHLTLLFFGYTHCPDVCPVHMSSIAQVKRDLGAEFGRDTKVIFVTVDPARDTPERIRSWLANFDPDFIGLRGDPDVVDSIQVGLGLPSAMVPMPPPDDGKANGDAADEDAAESDTGDDYLVGHGSPVVAWPADNSVRVDFPFGTRQEDWRHDLAKLAELDGER